MEKLTLYRTEPTDFSPSRQFVVNDLLNVVLACQGITRFTNNGFLLKKDEDQTTAEVVIFDEKIGRRWFVYKLRDRRFDGPGWQLTRLSNWHYHNEVDVIPAGCRAVEQSRYWGDPEAPLELKYSKDQAVFIENPFVVLPFNDPTEKEIIRWFNLWKSIIESDNLPYPGQFSLKTIPGLMEKIDESSKQMLREKGYNYLTSVPTWWHVALLNEHRGFEYTYQVDKQKIDKLKKYLPNDRKLASWIVVLQFLNELMEQNNIVAERIVGQDLVLRDEDGQILTYPLTPERNLWMHYKL